MVKEGELVQSQQVEVGNTRYKLRGWTRGEEVHVVEGLTRCEGLWDVEYRVRISIYLDGRLIDVKTMWASGPMTLDADKLTPPFSPRRKKENRGGSNRRRDRNKVEATSTAALTFSTVAIATVYHSRHYTTPRALNIQPTSEICHYASS